MRGTGCDVGEGGTYGIISLSVFEPCYLALVWGKDQGTAEEEGNRPPCISSDAKVEKRSR